MMMAILRSKTVPATRGLTNTARRLASQYHAAARTSCRWTVAPFGGCGSIHISPSSTSLKFKSTAPLPAAFITAASHTLPPRRLFAAEAATRCAAVPPSPTTTILPVMMTPSSDVAAAALLLLPPSTIESLQSLPECQSVFNILYGTTTTTTTSDGSNHDPTSTTQSLPGLLDNLHRSRDILHAFPELEVATYLLQVELLTYFGEFRSAIDCLARYEYLNKKIRKKNPTTREKKKGVGSKQEAVEDDNVNNKRKLQFLKAKLLYLSGQFTRALAEYEDILECMEEEVEAQVQRMELRQHNNIEDNQHPHKNKTHLVQMDDSNTAPLPVIHGAAALSAVGITKLLIHLRTGGYANVNDPSREYSNTSDIEEIIEAMETSADMLVESRKDALLSHEHANLAVDLGLAASIALTNLGVAHCLLRDDTSKAMELWNKGMTTIDGILQDAMNSLAVIPKHKFICMESLRARLYCNIAWVMLGNPAWERGKGCFVGPGAKLEDSTLKDASEAAKKALHIYDELMSGPKVVSDGGVVNGGSDEHDDDDDDVSNDTMEEEADDIIIGQELEQTLREHKTNHHEEEKEDHYETQVKMLADLPLSPQWFHHHQSESARALSLVAQCYALAGAAVTAEGVFRSAMDASSSYPLGQNIKSKDDAPGRKMSRKGVSLSSPNLGLIARDVRVWYAYLCDLETKRKSDGNRLRSDAWMIEDDGVLRGYVRDEEGVGKKQSVSGLESSLWLFSPSDFEI